MRLDIRFFGTWHGKKFYRVLQDGRPIFTGTRGECTRYARLRDQKQQKAMRDLRVPRRRKVQVRRFRVASRHVGAI